MAGAIDREADGPSRSITVRATSQDGSFTDQTFSIAIVDADEFDVTTPVDNNPAVNIIAENSANGTVVGITALASDADATTNAITYSLDDDAGGRFTINATTGVVTVADSSLLNYEAATNHTIVIRATSVDGSSATQNFTITLTDVNETAVSAVTDSDSAANFIVENSAIGSVVGITGLATDADGTDSVSYSLDNDAGGRFAINATTGVVTVAGAIDREAASSYDITVRATSTDGSSTTQIFTIQIGDVDEFNVGPVADTNATANSVTENASIGTAVGITASASDADATTSAITYSLVNNDGGRFAIDPTTGVVTVAGAIDREADGPSRSITVRATSQDGSFTDQTFSIAIVDVDEYDVTPATDTNSSINAVDENSANGTIVGVTAWAIDADATANNVSFTLDDNAGGRFAIDAITGVVTVANSQLLDFESMSSHTIVVRATSMDGSSSTSSMTININDVNEVPTATGRSFTINNVEVLNVANTVLQSGMSDPDGNALTVLLASGPQHGVLTLNSDGSFQYSANAGFVGQDSFMVQAFDGQLQSAPVMVTIVVTLPQVNPNQGSGGGSSGGSGSGSTSNNSTSNTTDSSQSNSNSNSSTTSQSNDTTPAGTQAIDPNRTTAIERAVNAQQQTPSTQTEETPLYAMESVSEQENVRQQATSLQLAMINWESLTIADQQLRSGGHQQAMRLASRRMMDTPMFEQTDLVTLDHAEKQVFSSFVEPAKWTVISTGVVIWAVRLGHIITTFASTASAWVYFDPLTVIQSVKDKTIGSESENITENMFDSDRKKKS